MQCTFVRDGSEKISTLGPITPYDIVFLLLGKLDTSDAEKIKQNFQSAKNIILFIDRRVIL
jgi:hypothetical protein